MFEKYYLVCVLSLCTATFYQMMNPADYYESAKPDTYFSSSQQQNNSLRYTYTAKDYSDDSSKNSSDEIMVAIGNIADKPVYHFRPFIP